MLSVSYAGKNAYSAGKTSGVLRGGASGANRCYVLAHCGGGVSIRRPKGAKIGTPPLPGMFMTPSLTKICFMDLNFF